MQSENSKFCHGLNAPKIYRERLIRAAASWNRAPVNPAYTPNDTRPDEPSGMKADLVRAFEGNTARPPKGKRY